MTEPTHHPRRARQAARSAGERRVQNVTLWTAAGSVVAAAVLSVVLAQSTSAATTPSTGGTGSTGTTPSTGLGTGTGGSDQLQPPATVPGSSGGGLVQGSSGAS